VARTLNENPETRLRIDGHASEEGTPEYNQALSERRAHAVREYLVGHGVVASRLVTEAFGETRPKYDNSREETRRLNRRAELKLLTEEDR
jgi:OmpA-OmpF porin, OOP family